MSDLETGAAIAAVPDSAPVSAPVTEAAPAPAVAVEAPDAPETPQTIEAALDADLGDIWDKANAPRDEAGRYKSANPAEPDTAIEVQSPETVAPEPAPPAIAAPVSWTREMAEQFATLPPAAKEYIAKRESEATAQISRLGQQVKQVEPVIRTLEQHRASFERNGMTYESGVKALLVAQDMLDTNPQAAIQEIARAYGVDLGSYAGQPQEGPSRDVLALQSQVAQLSQQLQNSLSRQRSDDEQKRDAHLNSLQTAVEDFSKDKADIALVESDMIALIPSIRQRKPGLSEKEILAQAYEQAVWINPTLREKRLADEKAKSAADALKKAEAARKAASINVRSGQNARPARMSVDDELSAVYDRMNG